MAVRKKYDLQFKERVLSYAEEHSGEKAARFFHVDARRIRYWKKQRSELQRAEKSRARLVGGGRKKVSLELESRLTEWIYAMRRQHSRVSRSMIKKKALEIYSSVSDGEKGFVASRGWLQRFLQRNEPELSREEIPEGVQQLMLKKAESPEEEEEDLWSSREGDQLQELKTEDSSEPETEDSEDWEETTVDQSSLKITEESLRTEFPADLREETDPFPLTPVSLRREDHEEKLAVRRKYNIQFKERVLSYAEEHSGEKAARFFHVDARRIRYWKKQRSELQRAEKSRARLVGGGRKKVSLELESRLTEWIYAMRRQHSRVSRSMIKKKALEIYSSVSDGEKGFVASRGWLQRFLQRNEPELSREEIPEDVQQLVVNTGQSPEVLEERSSSQDRRPPNIQEEADIRFLSSPVPVKSEDEEEKPQSSQLHHRQSQQMETGADGEDCGGPGPHSDPHPETDLEAESGMKTEDSEDSEGVEETGQISELL